MPDASTLAYNNMDHTLGSRGPSHNETNPIRIVQEYYITKVSFDLLCCYSSALTWVVLDHVLTFHDEVNYVWKRPMRTGSLLFYIMRYLGSASLLTGTAMYSRINDYPTLSMSIDRPGERVDIILRTVSKRAERAIYSAAPALQFSVFWAVELVLQSRIFALYGNERRLAVFNLILFCIEIVAMIALWCYLPASCYGAEAKPPRVFREDVVYTCNVFALYWVPGIAFELWLAALAFRKLKPQLLKHDLLSVIVRDSIRYFILIAVVTVIHVVSAFKEVGENAIPFVIAGVTIGGSRLVLHLRRAYFRGRDTTASNITFAVRTLGVPVLESRFADEAFYVQENVSDDELSDEPL